MHRPVMIFSRDPDTAELYVLGLQAVGRLVFWRSSVDDLLAAARSILPAAIVVDVRNDGDRELCRLLQASDLTRDIPVIRDHRLGDRGRQVPEAGVAVRLRRFHREPCLPDAIEQMVERVTHGAPDMAVVRRR